MTLPTFHEGRRGHQSPTKDDDDDDGDDDEQARGSLGLKLKIHSSSSRRHKLKGPASHCLTGYYLACWLVLSLKVAGQQYQTTSSHLHLNVTPSQMINQQQAAPTTAKPNYLETGRQITGILNRFMSLGYDKRVRPNYGGPPVEVNVTMRILSISSVSEVMMDFTADFYFRQTWHDPRLSFKKLGDIQTLYVGAEVSKKIWLPDTFFGNEKMAYFHEATTPNVFLRIDHSGEVYRSIRLTVTSSCPMNLQYFPMDRQRCTIEAESYGYNVKDIIYRWARKDTAVERDKEISLPQFDIVQTVQKYRLEELSSGTYSRLIAEIHFARRMGYYLIQIYIPSSLIVVISWVSFWLHRNASPARVQLGVTTVLTMTTLMSSTNAALPKISYVKSIDIFLGTCFVMVFAALLEYATVGYLGKRIAMRKAHAQHAQAQAQAKLFAQLQAQGAEGESVGPLGAIIPTTTAAPGGQTTGNLGLFGNSTEPNGGNGLMCSRSSPLDALLSDPSLYAAAAAAATAAVDQQQRVQHQNYHSNGRPQATADCQQASPQMCSCSKHNNAQTHHSNRHCPATMISHHCHSHQQPASQPAANCSYQQQQQHHHHHHHCRHHNHGPHDEHREQPQAPPRRNLPLHRQQKAPLDLGAGANSNNNINNNSSASCQQCHSSGGQNFKASSQTLPRNLTFAHDEYHSPSVAAAPFATTTRPNAACCRPQRQQQPPSYVCGSIPAPPSSQRQQAATLSAANLAQMSLGPAASPSKGASAAAAAAAATFVNLHRRNKGLPPSTNPNFAHFGAAQPLAAPYNRHLETIFGIRPSDIDKYSRVVFPVCFVCFQLMYWIVYLHISAFLEPDQQQQQPAATAALQAQQPPTPTT